MVIEGGELAHAKIIAPQLFPGRQWAMPVDTGDEISLKPFAEMFGILKTISYICNKKENRNTMNMGQCYSIILKVKVNDEAGLVKALKDKISRAEEERVDYSLDHFAELGIGTDTSLDLFKIFFAGWKGVFTSTPDGKLLADFDCSYGWEGVMITAFNEIAPYLKDNSYIKIYPDSGCDYAKVKDGKAVWKS